MTPYSYGVAIATAEGVASLHVNHDTVQWIHVDPPPNQIHYDILNIGLIVITVLILSLNIPVVVSVLASRLLHMPAFIFMLALALSDICVGLTCIAKVALPLDTESHLCTIYIAFFISPACASMLFMLWIALDRLIAISNALTYTQKVTRSRVCVVVTLTFVYSFLLGCAPLFGWRNQSFKRCSFMYVVHKDYVWFAFALGFLLPLLGNISIYIRIFFFTRTHIKRISSMELVFSSDGQGSEFKPKPIEMQPAGIVRNTIDVPIQNGSRRISSFRRTLKAVRTLAIVIGCFVITWFPFIITSIVQNICGNACALQDLIGTYLLMLGCFNSFLNPIIYAYWNKDFRQSVKSSCRICMLQRTSIKKISVMPISVISGQDRWLSCNTSL